MLTLHWRVVVGLSVVQLECFIRIREGRRGVVGVSCVIVDNLSSMESTDAFSFRRWTYLMVVVCVEEG